MNFIKKYIPIIITLFILLPGSGCRSGNPSFYIRQDIDFSFIKKVAIMPLENLSSNKFAGEAVRQLVTGELLSSGLVDVVVPGDVTTAIDKLEIKPITSPSSKQIKAIGKLLKVQAVIMGSVEKYSETKTANISAPEVTITLMMAETDTGSIIWSVTKTRGGASFMARHFGAKTKTMSETALEVVKEAVETFTEY